MAGVRGRPIHALVVSHVDIECTNTYMCSPHRNIAGSIRPASSRKSAKGPSSVRAHMQAGQDIPRYLDPSRATFGTNNVSSRSPEAQAPVCRSWRGRRIPAVESVTLFNPCSLTRPRHHEREHRVSGDAGPLRPPMCSQEGAWEVQH